MANTTTLNLRVNSTVKRQAEEILSKPGIPMSTAIKMYLRQINLTAGIPFSVELPKVPDEIKAELMIERELRDNLQKGYDDMEAGKVTDASEDFDLIRKKYSI